MNYLIALLSFVFISSEWASAIPQMWELDALSTDPTVHDLSAEGLVDHWSSLDNKIQVVVDSDVSSRVKRELDKKKIAYKTLENNLLNLIEEEERHLESKRRRRKRSAGQMDWTSYHRLNDIEGYLGWLNATQEGRVQVNPVAITEEGRRVYVVKVSNGIPDARKKKIWIEGGIHAREWISPAVTTYLLHQVATSPEFAPLLELSDWYFVPVANPDGYEFSFNGRLARLWRKNRKSNGFLLRGLCQGVDLNRNWPLKWGVGASSNPCSNIYKGSKPFSEPESAGISKVMIDEGPFHLFITFHSYGQTILYPWGWTVKKPKNHEELSKMGNRFVEAVRHASRLETTYKLGGSGEVYGLASGASDDWSYGKLHVPYAYTIELRDNGRYGFLLPENQIIDTVQETSVGVYCMASYLTGVGVCGQSAGGTQDHHNEVPSSRVIFE